MKRIQEILVVVQNIIKLFAFKLQTIEYHIASYFKNSEIHIYQNHQYDYFCKYEFAKLLKYLRHKKKIPKMSQNKKNVKGRIHLIFLKTQEHNFIMTTEKNFSYLYITKLNCKSYKEWLYILLNTN